VVAFDAAVEATGVAGDWLEVDEAQAASAETAISTGN
jgi:hypothetical protein